MVMPELTVCTFCIGYKNITCPVCNGNKLDIFAGIKQMVIAAMDYEERITGNCGTVVPVGMIDDVQSSDGGWDIHCENRENYYYKNNQVWYIGKDQNRW
jgi:hypothetical protein